MVPSIKPKITAQNQHNWLLKKPASLKLNRIKKTRYLGKKFSAKLKTHKIWIVQKRKKLTSTYIRPSSMLNLNIKFFNSIDGVYASHWVGKLMNTMIKNGQKSMIVKQFYKALVLVKYTRVNNPLLLVLEILDRIKPAFRLRNYIVRRVIVKQYPIVDFYSRRLTIALHWLKTEILNTVIPESSLAARISTVLLNFEPRLKNNLVKKRTEYTKKIIKSQFNIRYTWK